MDTFGARLQLVIEQSGLKKIQFADKMGISSAYVSQLCSDIRTPSDRLVADMCREFHIRREWLENGEGPMRLPQPEQDMSYIDILMQDCRSPFPDLVRAILIAYDRASPAGKQAINDYIQQVKAELGEK